MRFSISLLFKYLSMKITLQIDSKFQLFQMKSPLDSNRDFWMLVLGSTSKFFLIWWKCFKLEFLNLAPVILVAQFFSIYEKDGKLEFLFMSLGRLYFQISPSSLKSCKMGIFELPLVSYFVRLWIFQACVGDGEPIYD